MFDPDLRLHAVVAEDDVQKLSQLARGGLGRVADRRSPTPFVQPLEYVDPTDDPIANVSFRKQLQRKLDGLLDADVARDRQRLGFRRGNSVDHLNPLARERDSRLGDHRRASARARSTRSGKDTSKGGQATPVSVTKAVMDRAGGTSN